MIWLVTRDYAQGWLCKWRISSKNPITLPFYKINVWYTCCTFGVKSILNH